MRNAKKTVAPVTTQKTAKANPKLMEAAKTLATTIKGRPATTKETKELLSANGGKKAPKAPEPKPAVVKPVAKPAVKPVEVPKPKKLTAEERTEARRAAAMKAWETMRAKKGFNASKNAKRAWATRRENEGTAA